MSKRTPSPSEPLSIVGTSAERPISSASSRSASFRIGAPRSATVTFFSQPSEINVNEKTVENDFPGVVGQVKDRVGGANRFFKFAQGADERLVESGFDRGFDRRVVEFAEENIDRVAGDREANERFKGRRRFGDPATEARKLVERKAVEAAFLVVIRVGDAGNIVKRAVNQRSEERRRSVQTSFEENFERGFENLTLKVDVGRRETSRVQRLTRQTKDAVERRTHIKRLSKRTNGKNIASKGKKRRNETALRTVDKKTTIRLRIVALN